MGRGRGFATVSQVLHVCWLADAEERATNPDFRFKGIPNIKPAEWNYTLSGGQFNGSRYALSHDAGTYLIAKMGRRRCTPEAFPFHGLPSQGQHALGNGWPMNNQTNVVHIQCNGIPDNGDPLWMGQTFDGWWLLGSSDSWLELPAGMDPRTTHVRLGTNNEVPTDMVDPPRLPNQIEVPYSALAWADDQCIKTLNGKHQFFCSKACFGDPYQGYSAHCAVARSAWVAKNPRVRRPAQPPVDPDSCRYDYDCAPTSNRGKWQNVCKDPSWMNNPRFCGSG